jgi:CBS domain-containing protein
VTRSTPIPIAARKLERHRIHRLVVVADEDETLPIGVLSTTDLVHSIAVGHTPATDAAEDEESAAG